MMKLPNFSLPVTTLETINLSKLKGKNVVVYFYPKDSTPGCTIEGHNFRDNYAKFQKLNTEIFGVSRDKMASHMRFKEKHKFPFELISDEDKKLCEYFDVITEKSMFGKKYMGIVRSTFLFDMQGNLVQEWRKVSIKGHVDEVLEAVLKINHR